MKKCKKHFNALSLVGNEPMDTTFYEIGPESECSLCAREKIESAAKAKKAADDFDEALTTFLTTDTGTDRKKAAIDIFLSS